MENIKKETFKDVDVSRYHDRSGITMKKLQIGFWLVKNRNIFINIFYGILLFFSVLSWGLFIFYFGEYLLIGIFDEGKMLQRKVNTMIVDHGYLYEKSAIPIEVLETDYIKANNDHIDLFAKASNSNDDFIAEFEYSFVVDGEVQYTDKSVIYPNEIKYIIALNQDYNKLSPSVKINIDKVVWTRINHHIIPNWRAFRDNRLENINVNDINFQLANSTGLSEKVNLNKLSFTVDNKTAYNYLNLQLNIILFKKNQVVGVNKYIVDKLASAESKDVEIVWPGNFGHINSFLVMPDVNILDKKAYFDFEGGIGELK